VAVTGALKQTTLNNNAHVDLQLAFVREKYTNKTIKDWPSSQSKTI